MKRVLLCFFILSVLWCSVQSGNVGADADVHAQIREMLKAEPALILDVLRDHPLEFVEILEQAVLARQEHDRRKQEQADMATPRDPEIFPGRPMRGNPDAPVTIVEYSDFLCPYCSVAAATVKELMAKDDDSVRLVFKHLPLNPLSRELALAFEAAALQDPKAAWVLHDMLYERQKDVQKDYERVLNDFVQKSGVNQQRFFADRKNPELVALLEKDMEEARRFGFKGTPMFLINGIAVRGAVPLQEFERVIELVQSKFRDSATP
ncbi:MAG TPA: disulfide bond formation protein DsbA [Desulfonatronum sp.]|nr:disulfide bond formation protein DsbA [Desulfonatronum sp.]